VTEPVDDAPATITIPTPRIAPFNLPITSRETIQEVWDEFVKPDQEAGILQSIEMRALMAILRAVYQGLPE
jgi:hypothetical protein